MFGNPKRPKDRTTYPRSSNSRPLRIKEQTGRFVFVVDLEEAIHVAPDQLHMHPRVLGGAESALYAGEIVISAMGEVEELTNCSGTFQFKSRRSLCCVSEVLRRMGFMVGEVLWFPPDGKTRPQRLQCD